MCLYLLVCLPVPVDCGNPSVRTAAHSGYPPPRATAGGRRARRGLRKAGGIAHGLRKAAAAAPAGGRSHGRMCNGTCIAHMHVMFMYGRRSLSQLRMQPPIYSATAVNILPTECTQSARIRVP